MSSVYKKKKKKAINMNALFFLTLNNHKNKYQNLKLSLANKLVNNDGRCITDKKEKIQEKSARINQSEMSKTMFETRKNYISKYNDNHLTKRNRFISSKKDENKSINNIINNYMETNKIKKLYIEYPDAEPMKKQKFVKTNKKFINKDILFNNFFFNNLSRNNNNYSCKKNIEINNYTQTNINFGNQKLIALYKGDSKNKNKIILTNRYNKISRNNPDIILNRSSRKNSLNSKLKNQNIFRTYNYENGNIKNNPEKIMYMKKKKIQILNYLTKNDKKSLYKKLLHKDKIINDIKRSILSKSKLKLYQPNSNKINLFQKDNKLNNTISIINKSIKQIKKIKDKKIIKKTSGVGGNSKSTIELCKTNINKNIRFSSNPPKTKGKSITKIRILKKVSKLDSCTLAGYSSSGVKKINQDNFFIKNNFLGEKNQFFIGVCDGHGDNGHHISSYISQCLPNFLADTKSKSIISSFNSLNQNLVKNTKIDCTFSGSTCTSIILNQEKIISINLGDSRTILAKCDNGIYTPMSLSNDHKPNVITEKKRILINGGRIQPFYSDKIKKFVGPDRVWIKEDNIPGLAMTRSFGDTLAHTVGVISEPEIKKYKFSGNEKFIVLASDGIWEQITNEECVNIIKDYYENNMDAIGAINSIMKEAFNRWKKNGEIIDDITIIIIFFE